MNDLIAEARRLVSGAFESQTGAEDHMASLLRRLADALDRSEAEKEQQVAAIRASHAECVKHVKAAAALILELERSEARAERLRVERDSLFEVLVSCTMGLTNLDRPKAIRACMLDFDPGHKVSEDAAEALAAHDREMEGRDV